MRPLVTRRHVALVLVVLCSNCYSPSRTVNVGPTPPPETPSGNSNSSAPAAAHGGLAQSKVEALEKRCIKLTDSGERAACDQKLARLRAEASAAVPSVVAPIADSEVRVTLAMSSQEIETRNVGRVAIPRVEGAGVSNDMVAILTDAAVDAASLTRGIAIIGATDIDSMLGFERQKDLVGCDEASCMAEIAGALGVDAMLSVKLGKIGETFRVSATLFDTRIAKPLVRGSARVRDVNALLDVVDDLVPRVMQPVARAR